jgi:hypothetical protein
MARPDRIMDEFVGPKRLIPTDRLAEAAQVSERTALHWREEAETREPSYSDLQNIFESTLIPVEFKTALANDLFRRSHDVKAAPCGGAAHEDAHPMTLAIDAAGEMNELQQLIDDAACPRSPGGAHITTGERGEMETVRARFDVVTARLWKAIERRTLRSQTA